MSDEFITFAYYNVQKMQGTMRTMVAPSLLSANFADLKAEMDMINRSECDWLHIDIMDGVFVPNISFGFPVLKHVARLCKKPLDVHLMIVRPEKFLNEVKDLGAYSMNVHVEACTHLHRVVQQIKDAGIKAGVTLNPATPVSVLEEVVEDLDIVMLMAVNPGFGGQKFITHTLDKVARLRRMIDSRGAGALIEVDGGVNRDTGRRLYEAGADVLVAGNFVFKSPDPRATIQALKAL